MRKIKYKNSIIIKFINENIKEIFTVSMIFLIGIILGILFLNNIKDERKDRSSKLY